MRDGAHARCKDGWHCGLRHWSCDEGGQPRRAARPRAHRGHRALLRGGAQRRVPRAARREKPIRQHERTWSVRDARRWACRCAGRIKALSLRARNGERIDHRADGGGDASAARRSAGTRRADAVSATAQDGGLRRREAHPAPPCCARKAREAAHRRGGCLRQGCGWHPS